MVGSGVFAAVATAGKSGRKGVVLLRVNVAPSPVFRWRINGLLRRTAEWRQSAFSVPDGINSSLINLVVALT